MGNEASGRRAAMASPVMDIVEAARDEVRAPALAIGLNAAFIGCKQKYDDSRRACSGERPATSAATVACIKAGDELRGCMQANVDVIKGLAESAHAMKEDEYSPIGARSRK